MEKEAKLSDGLNLLEYLNQKHFQNQIGKSTKTSAGSNDQETEWLNQQDGILMDQSRMTESILLE